MRYQVLTSTGREEEIMADRIQVLGEWVEFHITLETTYEGAVVKLAEELLVTILHRPQRITPIWEEAE